MNIIDWEPRKEWVVDWDIRVGTEGLPSKSALGIPIPYAGTKKRKFSTLLKTYKTASFEERN